MIVRFFCLTILFPYQHESIFLRFFIMILYDVVSMVNKKINGCVHACRERERIRGCWITMNKRVHYYIHFSSGVPASRTLSSANILLRINFVSVFVFSLGLFFGKIFAENLHAESDGKASFRSIFGGEFPRDISLLDGFKIFAYFPSRRLSFYPLR